MDDFDVNEDVLVNLHQKSDQELREILDKLYAEEEQISYQRRILHGKIDIIRAELVERLKGSREEGRSAISSRDIQRLSEILAKGGK